MGLEGLAGWNRRADFFLDAIDRFDSVKHGDPAFLAVSFMKTQKVDREATRLLLQSVGDTDPAELERITMPTLVLCGASLLTTIGAAKAMGYDSGTAAGLMAGAFTESTVIGTAGTATTMAAVALALSPYDPDAVTGFKLSPGDVEVLYWRLAGATVAERRELRGMEPQRADVIAAGVAIYARVVERIAAPLLITCDRGIRWGLAYERAH